VGEDEDNINSKPRVRLERPSRPRESTCPATQSPLARKERRAQYYTWFDAARWAERLLGMIIKIVVIIIRLHER
jgi:hypothetical protein